MDGQYFSQFYVKSAIYVYFSLYDSISKRNISFLYCLRTINMLSDTVAACDVINLFLCLGMYESPLNKRKVQSRTTTHTHTHTQTNISREISCWGRQFGRKSFAVGRSITWPVTNDCHPTVATAYTASNQFAFLSFYRTPSTTHMNSQAFAALSILLPLLFCSQTSVHTRST